MTHPLDVLDGVQVAEPCNVLWDQMRGTDTARHCDRCNKTVHNLSEMSAADASALLAVRGSGLCVRFARRADGAVVTRDRPVRPTSRIRWIMRRAVVALGSCVGLALATGCGERRTMGAVCTARGDGPAPTTVQQTPTGPPPAPQVEAPPPRPVNAHQQPTDTPPTGPGDSGR
jgi:hypothetical protein